MAEKIKKNISELPNKAVAGKFLIASTDPVMSMHKANIPNPDGFVVCISIVFIIVRSNKIEVYEKLSYKYNELNSGYDQKK